VVLPGALTIVSDGLGEMIRRRVVVAMSGGVDSSVAAALLVKQGYDVIGIMLRLWSEADNGTGPANRCCALDAQYDAQRVADLLGIPFYLVNVADDFRRHVVDYFEDEYASGRTPNPCIECNRQIRFDVLLRRVLALGAEYLATGHYARVTLRDGRYLLLRGKDRRKDQSYVLHTLGQTQLPHVIFPLGELFKDCVRTLARELALPVAERRDSQDLCFVTDGDYRLYLSKRMPNLIRPGPVRDSAGRVLGEHGGLANYTVGQRKGLGITAPEPMYVLALKPKDNALIVGPAGELGRDVCFAHGITWVAGEPPSESFEALAKIRYNARETAVRVTTLSNRNRSARVVFHQPQRDITPGQALVLYQDDMVVGGGTISWFDQDEQR
jgi:tRNA-specific 2-thiouridylase